MEESREERKRIEEYKRLKKRKPRAKTVKIFGKVEKTGKIGKKR